MKKLKITLLYIALLLAAAGCTKQRDLYVKAPAMIAINTLWVNAPTPPDIWTAMLYNGNKYSLTLTHVKDSITIKQGNYEALTVNGTLSNGIDYVRFRGVDAFDTFEAYATLKSAPLIFDEFSGKTINHPDTLYGTSTYKRIAGDDGYYIKYQNGRNGFHIPAAHLGDTIVFVPQRLTYKVTVIATLYAFENAAKNTYIVANQSGFAGSVFVGSGLPSHQSAYHEFSLERATSRAATTYTSTAHYNSFGPPLDLESGSRSYTVRLKMVLRDGTLYTKDVDVSDQVEAIIRKIRQEHITGFTIYITDTLPAVQDTGMEVGVAPWDKDVYIPIPVG